jgi:hypothetical protein
VRRYLYAALLLIACTCLASVAFAEEEVVFTGQEDVFDHMRATHGGSESNGRAVEEAIGQFYKGGEEDEGTFPASEIWDHDFSFRTSPPPTWGYSGRTFFRYSEDDISGVDKWEKEFELNLSYGNWRSYFRAGDFNTFAYENDPGRLEKARLKYDKDDLKVTVGSLGGLFGRGLMLSMYEDRTLEFDNEVEGAKVEYTLGNAEVTALWGTRKNRNQPHDSEIVAARVQMPIGENLTVGVHAGQVQFPKGTSTEGVPHMLDYNLYGANVEAKFDDLTAYAETVKLKRSAEEYGSSEWDMTGNDGRGHYLNIGFNKSWYALTAEFKDYKGIEQPFSVLPAVRKWEDQASANPLDDKGYLYSAQVRPFKTTGYFEFSYGQGNAHVRSNPHTEMGGSYHSPATDRTSYILEMWRVNHLNEHHNIATAQLDHRLNNDFTLTGKVEHEKIYEETNEGYVDYQYIAEVAYQSLANLVYTYEETGDEFATPSVWGLWEFKVKPDEQQEINLVFGQRRAGYVCSGGVCRLEPAFDGVKIDYLFRF